MKILILSLLRLGDILMLAPVLQGLRKRHPDAQIDIFVNQPNSIVKNLLPEINRVFMLDRQSLQDGLVQSEQPLFSSFDRLRIVCNELSSQQYDLLINLTQNKMSGYLASYIEAEEKIGLVLNEKGQAQFGSQWFRYLNDVIGAGAEVMFHYSDVYYAGLQLPLGEQQFEFAETEFGKMELQSFLLGSSYSSDAKIAIQFLTSDEKKNWHTDKWIRLIDKIKTFYKTAQIILLAAPNEAAHATALQSQILEHGHSVDVAVLSLEGVLSLFHICDLVITGDTSIKHLASGTNISILEIALGSSDLRKTGAYKSNSLIVKSRESCSPCPHNQSCSREKHFCGDSIDAEAVAIAGIKLLQKDWAGIRTLSSEYNDCMTFYRTYLSKNGFWSVELLEENSARESLSQHFDKVAWKFLLEKEHLKPLAEYGSEGRRLTQHVLDNSNVNSAQLMKYVIEQIESFTESNESKINKVLSDLTHRLRRSGGLTDVDFIDRQLQKEIKALEKELGLGSFLTEKINISRTSGLYRMRQLQSSLNEVFSHQQIKLKLIRSFKTQILEYQ